MKDLHAGAAVSSDFAAATIVGISDWANEIREQIREFSRFSLGILVSGPNGTGKELVARAVHAHSDRADRPFIAVDCASAMRELFPSHLFGQAEGAFTGARQSLGCFRVAEGGTLFLDEIGELDPQLQAQLLRALEVRVIVPVGGVGSIPFDVRIIAATNRDLHQDVVAGRFRRDLYHRLNTIELKTIALKDHPEDIEGLAGHLVTAFCREFGRPASTVSAAALHALRAYDWPGNVRELKNVLQRLLLVHEGNVITPQSLRPLLSSFSGVSETLADTSAGPLPGDVSSAGSHDMQQVVAHAAAARETGRENREAWLRLDDLVRYHIQQTLEHTLYNRTAAADLLGITRRVLSRLIDKHGLS